MPTGYTAGVQSGDVTEFRAFAMLCARAMGACIMQRDDPMDQPAAEQQPSDHCAKQLESARTQLHVVRDWTRAEAQAAADADFVQRSDHREKRTAERAQAKARYEAMAAKVAAWTRWIRLLHDSMPTQEPGT